MKEHTLECLNPIVNGGLNVTVRLGEKWAAKCSIGDTLNICKTGSTTPFATGIVNGIIVLPFRSIPKEILQLEHDPRCTDQSGLHGVLKEAYGDKFSAMSLCTLIVFEC